MLQRLAKIMSTRILLIDWTVNTLNTTEPALSNITDQLAGL